jgi:hypothetical protein
VRHPLTLIHWVGVSEYMEVSQARCGRINWVGMIDSYVKYGPWLKGLSVVAFSRPLVGGKTNRLAVAEYDKTLHIQNQT